MSKSRSSSAKKPAPPPDNPMTPPPVTTPGPIMSGAAPQRYGRYILIDRLGAGGMAEVFRALVLGPENFQRMVVVKRILPDLSAKPGFIKMFIDEATICGRLSHPNVIQVHEFGKQDATYFIAMEYVQGRPLGSIMSRLGQMAEYMPTAIAAEISRQTCLGLAYAHSLVAVDGQPLHIVHRDVSPGNVMVTWTGAVKVLDFGIARVENEFRVGNTDVGQVKGKSAYLAPEQISANGVIDERADVFAAGILLHEMLSGRRLFKAATAVETMKLIKDTPIPKPSAVNPEVPVRLEAIVMRALSRDPADRYQNAHDMAEALESFLIEQRFSSQELGRFMRRIFKDESGNDHAQLTNAELESLKSAKPESGDEEPQANTGDGPDHGVVESVKLSHESLQDEVVGPGGLLAEWPEMGSEVVNQFAMEDEAKASRKRRLLIVGGVGAAALLGLLFAIVSGRSSRPVAAPEPTVAVVPSPPPAASPPPPPAPAPAVAAPAPVVAAPADPVPVPALPVPQAPVAPVPVAVAPATPPAPPPPPKADPIPVPVPAAPPVAVAPVPVPPPVVAPVAEKAPPARPVVVPRPKPVAVVAAPKPVPLPPAPKPVVAAPKPAPIIAVPKPAPVAEKPAVPSVPKSPTVRRKTQGEKVRNAIPIDPFAQ